jgi:glycosyltransferase involved in cell wall biosynthesis
MRIFILSDAGSIHTKRWVTSLAQNEITIFLFSIHPELTGYYEKIQNVYVYSCNVGSNENTNFSKWRYVKVLNRLKRTIRKFQPDILHAHYASSYGLLGALTGFHPYIISVWGSDVYDFPQMSMFHSFILKYNLSKADRILSTSYMMAKETQKYTTQLISITPFGVDINLFKKEEIKYNNDCEFIVGNVKTLSPKYGIDVLINAFKIVLDSNPDRKIRLDIIGDGRDKEKLKQLTIDLGISDKIFFRGEIDNHLLPQWYNQFSVSVSVSDSESFGVVAVEAMACECPVVVSDADGFTEVVKDGKTGFIVPKRDIQTTAKAIQKFIDDPTLRGKMGANGRKRVLELYNWNENVKTMIDIYKAKIVFPI